MAKNVSLWGADYPNVPALNVPQTGGGTARFTDTSPTTAVDSDVASGKIYFKSDGTQSIGTASGGGGSSVAEDQVDTELASASYTISFSGLLGEPTSFIVQYDDGMTLPSGTPYRVISLVFDGTSYHGQTLTNINNAQVSYDGSNFTSSYSNGTLTITSSSSQFIAGWWVMSYTYGGTGGNIQTSDVQVGSGATSITFAGLEDEPLCWWLVFKDNFSTSNGYQRVISMRKREQGGGVVNIYGFAMDSQAHGSSTYWSESYNNGSLTITSQGTNNGGYFHQPGYYQLTYIIDATGNYQTKSVTYTPTTSQQTASITADAQYDALKKVNVTVDAMPTMTLPNSASGTSSGTSKATINPTSSVQYLNIPTGYNATAQYYTIGASGGGGGFSVGTTTWNNTSNTTTSHQFTGLSGTPKFAVLRCTTQLTRSSSNTYYYIADIVWNGTSAYGNYHLRSNGSYNNMASGASGGYTVTTGTNSITFTSGGSRSGAGGSFYNGTYELTYIY